MIAAPLLIHSILAGVGCVLAIYTGRSVMLRVYLGFVALAALSGIPVMIYASPEVYRVAFFSVEITHNVLLLFLAIQTISEITPGKWAAPWCLFWMAMLIYGAVHQTVDAASHGLLNLSTSVDFAVCGVLLFALFHNDAHWTRENALCAAGIGLVALGSAVPEIRLLTDRPALRVAMQWADIPGLMVLLSGVTGSSTSLKNEKARTVAA